MKIAVISFTQNGNICNRQITAALKKEGHDAEEFTAFRRRSPTVLDDMPETGQRAADPTELTVVSSRVSEWTKAAFNQYDALVFVGAAAIAVRSIAPCVRDKLTDPAVLVVDEKGQYVVPILSGHVGGANGLARQLAADLQALPVITTATDIQGLFAVDIFAVKNRLILTDRVKAKKISAAILEHECQQVYIDGLMAYDGKLPKYLGITGDIEKADILIDYHLLQPDMKGLCLLPEGMIWMGIGCRKGTEAAKIKEAINHFIQEHEIDKRAIAGLASIDVKANEQGILEVCRENSWPFVTFTSERLSAQEGNFTASDFVKSKVGVDNVCERAALCAAGDMIHEEKRELGQNRLSQPWKAELLVKKEIMPGITLAAAGAGRRLKFE